MFDSFVFRYSPFFIKCSIVLIGPLSIPVVPFLLRGVSIFTVITVIFAVVGRV